MKTGWLLQCLPLLRAGSSTMQDLAHSLAGLRFDAPGRGDLAVLQDCFLKKDGQPSFAKVPTTKVRMAMGIWSRTSTTSCSGSPMRGTPKRPFGRRKDPGPA